MSTLKTVQRLSSVLLVILMLAGCNFGEAQVRPEPAKEDRPDVEVEIGNAAGDPEAEMVLVKPAEPRDEAIAPAESPALDSAATSSEIALAPAPTVVLAEAARGSAAGGEGVAGYAAEARPAQPLRAGEVDDNAQWDDYLLYRRQSQGLPVHDRDVSERYVIEVKDGQGRPVLGATVRFLAGQQEIYRAQTYANGQVLFQPLALNQPLAQIERFQVQVEKDNLREELTLTRLNAQTGNSLSQRWTVTLDTRAQAETINLDVLFLVDATGSMADEIAKIQNTIFDVSARIDALPGQPNVRYGMVTYRDRGDEFVTRSYEFTPDVQAFSADLNTVYADGGGDTPESLNEALHAALHGVEWRGGQTIQLIFLIADAPPHLDYPQDYDYAVEMAKAAERGIKIFPIASSGLDDQGEYIFRQLAQYTQGRFIFLTYEGPTNGGTPGDVTTHHVDDYSVANLDDLLVKLVQTELAYQSSDAGQ
ncbi:MAG: VWA domain-containing protein, partial [Anaerolineae bacterium]